MDYRLLHTEEVSPLPKQGISLEVILIMISQEEKSDDIPKKDADAYVRFSRDVSKQCRFIKPLLMRTPPDPTSLSQKI